MAGLAIFTTALTKGTRTMNIERLEKALASASFLCDELREIHANAEQVALEIVTLDMICEVQKMRNTLGRLHDEAVKLVTT